MLDLFLPEGLNEDQRLTFPNSELANQWEHILMNTQEMDKKIKEMNQQRTIREEDNINVD